MKKIAIILFSILVFSACTRKEEQSKELNALRDLGWLQQKVTELEPCTCSSVILQSRYEGQDVFEFYTNDPLCNGINQVYRQDGTFLFGSPEQAAYATYLDKKTNSKIIWTCTSEKHE